jgi:prepilin-type N-terminal cleavage/methylation domain-containing protein
MKRILKYIHILIKDNSRGVTLIELVIVSIIVGIIASIAFPGFVKMKEAAMDREVKAALKLIQSAQKIYRMEKVYYYGDIEGGTCVTDATANINQKLYLDLINQNWNFCIDTDSTHTFYDAKGIRKTGTARTWHIGTSSTEPTCNGTGCL